MVSPRRALFVRAYEAALRAYPRVVRDRFGAGMRDAFEQDLEQAGRRGRTALAWFAAVSCIQAIWFGVLERLGVAARVFQADRARRRFASGSWIAVRDAYRSLRGAPVVAVVAIGSLALGIGANTALFSILNSLVFKPLPVREPERLALLDPGSFSNPVWEEIRDRHARDATAGAFAWSVERFNLAASGEMDFVDGIYASGSLFEVLGVSAALGRTFDRRDDVFGGGAAGRVAVISHGLWRRRYGGASDAIGRTVTIEQHPFTIVGVMPSSFFGPDVGRVADIILPIGAAVGNRRAQLRTAATWMNIMVRLKPGQSVDQAAEYFRAVQPRIRVATQPDDRRPDQHLADPFTLAPAANGRSTLRLRYETPLTIILVVVGIVLLSACANLANLFLARATARQPEFSVRLALGAARWHLARQLIIESVMLAIAGSALGLIVAQWGSALLVRQLATATVPVVLDLAIDWRVLGYSIAAAVLASVLLGLAPAASLARLADRDVLKSQGRSITGEDQSFTRSLLLVTQVALSLVLAVVAALFLRSFVTLTSVPLGFDPDRLTAVAVDIQRASTDLTSVNELAERLRVSVAAVPGVASAAVSYTTPLAGRGWNGYIRVPDRAALPERASLAWVNLVSPGFFSTYGMQLLQGRDLGPEDVQGRERVAVVNEAFIRRFFPGENAIGQRFSGGTAESETHTIVGVVPDAVYRSQRLGAPPTMYVAWAQQEPFSTFSITARSAGPRPPSEPAIREALRREAPAVAYTIREFGEQHRATIVQERLVTMLSMFFGALALLLAALGLYGVTSYLVGRRRAELGVRLALGANSRDIRRLILRRLIRLIGLGIAAGTAMSLWAVGFIGTQLFELQPRDPITLAAAAAVLLVVGVIAGWLPASRAARIDPVIVLRG
jgi:predicted permease